MINSIAEPIPMKRELKQSRSRSPRSWDRTIAEPIPMKRELKLRFFAMPRLLRAELQSLSR